MLCKIVFAAVQIALAFAAPNYRILDITRNDVTFRLYNRNNDNFTPIFYTRLNAVKDVIKADSKVKFIIHGWRDSANNQWYSYLKQEYMLKGDYVVIGVDWTNLAKSLYPFCMNYVPSIGEFVGELVLDLHYTLGVRLSNVHLVGHSLGAHAAGHAGKYVNANSQEAIGRISGLDPAGPFYVYMSRDYRLCDDDAAFVDAIHTDGGKFGYFDPIGHADFYPNGGQAPQKGCYFFSVNDIIDVASCSHTRAYWLFGESINSDGFRAKLCDKLDDYEHGKCDGNPETLMGENVDSMARGSFYLSTNSAAPFANNGQK